MEHIPVLLLTLGATIVVMVAIWLLSVRISDASIVDLYWGPGFVVIVWIAYAMSDRPNQRGFLVAILTTLWGIRLAAHLYARFHQHVDEDFRYAAMRSRNTSTFTTWSLTRIFILQAVVMWVVSVPIQHAQIYGKDATWSPITSVGLALFVAGFLIEATADWQLSKFKKRTSNRGRMLTTGLWRWSQHPNYFGELLIWWGFYCLVLDLQMGPWLIFSPLLLSYLIVRVSGRPLLDAHLAATKKDHAEYAKRTSSIIPWPKKKNSRN